ncbi:MAG: hypothetical protein FWD15_03580 [Alphaproteobacteria bacterium]|nr:hypothetical protein [Alphaproteobacteria bacterium]
MSATDFLMQSLTALKKEPVEHNLPPEELIEKIFRIIVSKKFRKYSAKPELYATIKSAVSLALKNQTPLPFLFPQGAYKLWRLAETPRADWGELFFLMHVAKPLCEICALHKPGVEFDVLLDDIIVERMNNIPLADMQAYIDSYKATAKFLKRFLPDNFNIKFTGVSQLYESEAAYWAAVEKNLKEIPMPTLDDYWRQVIELNYKPTPATAADPLWREKSKQIHDAHMTAKRAPGYHLDRDDKVLFFAQPIANPAYLSVGTTKNSIARHWCGVGVLKRRGDSFEMTNLPPSRIPPATETVWEEVNLPPPALSAEPNFKRIRIINE